MSIIKFQLDYIEEVSVLRAFATMPHTISYFVKICWMIIYDVESYKSIMTRNRGTLLGWAILQEMSSHYSKEVGTI